MTSKTSAVIGALVLAGLGMSGEVLASCTASATNVLLSVTQLNLLLTGNTACAVRGNERWQELHQANGDVIDFKQGPGHAVDPSEKVGTWSTSGGAGNPRVRYNYGSGGTFEYAVFSNGSTTYSFCVGAAELPVTIKPGGGACP